MFDPNDPKICCSDSVTKRYYFACDGRDCPVKAFYFIFDQVNGNPLRVFLKRGHTGLCVQALLEAVGRLVTIVFQKTDLDLEVIWRTLIGIQCAGGFVGRVSCMDALGRELKYRYANRQPDELEELCAPTD